MGQERQWPTCAVCCDQHNGWWPVEEYEVVWERPRSHNDRARAIVIGRCSHGRDFKKGTVREQRTAIDVPLWWGDAHVSDAISLLTFFAQGVSSPDHGLVTRIA